MIEEAEKIQDVFNAVYAALEKYIPKKEPYIELRQELLINSKNFYDGRKLIIDAFKNKIFPMVPIDSSEDEESSESEDDREPIIKEEKLILQQVVKICQN